ncbi:hypothetical protein ACWGS9_34940 [Bradyrhizobium sp. Arg314]
MRAIFEIEAGLQGAKGDLTVVVGPNRGGSAEVEIPAILQVSFDDPPAADQLTAGRCDHVGIASSFGNRTRL